DRAAEEDDVPRLHVGHLPRPGPAAVGRPIAQRGVAVRHRLLRPQGGGPPAHPAGPPAPDHAGSIRLRRGADLRRLDAALAPSLLRRWPLRAPYLAAAGSQAGSRPHPHDRALRGGSIVVIGTIASSRALPRISHHIARSRSTPVPIL